jgi:hypothetical protein
MDEDAHENENNKYRLMKSLPTFGSEYEPEEKEKKCSVNPNRNSSYRTDPKGPWGMASVHGQDGTLI